MPHSKDPKSLHYRTLIEPLTHIRAALARLDLEGLARRSGFLRRRPRKIPILDLLLAFCALAWESTLSLERIASVSLIPQKSHTLPAKIPAATICT